MSTTRKPVRWDICRAGDGAVVHLVNTDSGRPELTLSLSCTSLDEVVGQFNKIREEIKELKVQGKL